MQQEILDTLFGDRDIISDLIVELSPANAQEKQQLRSLMVRRDRLTMCIQDVINSEIDSSTQGLGTALQNLEQASAKLAALSKTFASIVDAIALVDQLVQLVTSLVSVTNPP